jgi:hypothetical protein
MFKKTLISLVTASLVLLPSYGIAGLIGTSQSLVASNFNSNKEKVSNFLSRQDVASKLEMLGIAPSVALERVNSMTEEEIDRISQTIDTAPAGGLTTTGGAIIAATVVVIVIAILTLKK